MKKMMIALFSATFFTLMSVTPAYAQSSYNATSVCLMGGIEKLKLYSKANFDDVDRSPTGQYTGLLDFVTVKSKVKLNRVATKVVRSNGTTFNHVDNSPDTTKNDDGYYVNFYNWQIDDVTSVVTKGSVKYKKKTRSCTSVMAPR